MCSNFIDSEVLLLGNEQWMNLEEKWGKPVDLDADEEQSTIHSHLSTWDSKTTFNTESLFKNISGKVVNKSAKHGTLNYKEFIQDLKNKIAYQQCYFMDAQMLSVTSVEYICDQIDDIFRSVERLYSATSTVRRKPIPGKVHCSISTIGLSFDDTPLERTKSEEYDYIEEALDKLSLLSNTYMTIEDKEVGVSVTALVKKFSMMLAKPVADSSPKKQEIYKSKFQELQEFWKNLAEAEGVTV